MDGDQIPWGQVLGQGGPWGLVTLFVVLVLTGRLITIAALRRELGYLQSTIKDKDNAIAKLEKALETEKAGKAVLAETNKTLADGLVEPVGKVLGSIQQAAEGAGERH